VTSTNGGRVSILASRFQAGIVAAILGMQPPPTTALQPVTPPALDHVITTCLAKDPEERWQSAADIVRELRWIAESNGPAPTIPMPTISSQPQSSRWSLRPHLAWGLATTAVLIAAALFIVGLTMRSRPSEAVIPPRSIPTRFMIADRPTLEDPTVQDPQRAFAISPDGRRIVYASDDGGVRRLWVRDLSASKAMAIAGTESGIGPFFSPDGQWIGFFTDDRLKKASLTGGGAVSIATIPFENPRGAVWAADGTIVLAPTADGGLWRISAGGGEPRLVAQPDGAQHERSYRWPEMLPDGKTVVFTIGRSDTLSFDDGWIAVRSLETGAQRTLLRT
jgi:hypothetical protein